MEVDRVRRWVLGALLGAGLGASRLPPAKGLTEGFAPLSGTVWQAATRPAVDRVESPDGPATVTYDDHGVPTIEAGDDEALGFAVGYTHAADRLFQMDLFRRLIGGRLAAAVGERAVESDVFNVAMDFRGAAEAGWAANRDGPQAPLMRSYSTGVNAYIQRGRLPPEFGLLGYEPEPWTPVDTLLIEKLISWGLTGSFRVLRETVARRELGDDLADELYPTRFDHDVPIIRDEGDPDTSGTQHRRGAAESPADIGTGLARWLGRFESPRGTGSNSWVVSGEHTVSGKPLLANDPHLELSVPPVWYQQQLRTPDLDVRGVAFPGVPFVVIGTSHAGTWGFTNAGTSTIGFYRYDIDGERYRYRDEWRAFDAETRTVEVADGRNREVTVRKTVHGPLVEREGERVGVAWVGHTATATSRAVYELNHAGGLDDVLAAIRRWDAPAQNFVWAGRAGRTMYYLVGRHPIRRVAGRRVPGDRIFDGSAGEGEWTGFEPFGTSTWSGFVPFEDKPHVIDPPYIGTANQRIVDSDAPYLHGPYASPFRARRLYERLDDRAETGPPMDVPFMKELQLDAVDGRAGDLVPALLDAVDGREELADAVTVLAEWDHRMTVDSRAALLFARWFDRYEDALYEPLFDPDDLDESYRPPAWVTATLEADSPVFRGRDRETLMAEAFEVAVREVEDSEWSVYGDYSHTGAITHPFDLAFLNYPAIPAGGSGHTLRNFNVDRPTGSSWRQVVDLDDGAAEGILPGGNAGLFFDPHYADRLRHWVDGRYSRLDRPSDDEPDVTFVGTSA